MAHAPNKTKKLVDIWLGIMQPSVKSGPRKYIWAKLVRPQYTEKRKKKIEAPTEPKSVPPTSTQRALFKTCTEIEIEALEKQYRQKSDDVNPVVASKLKVRDNRLKRRVARAKRRRKLRKQLRISSIYYNLSSISSGDIEYAGNEAATESQGTSLDIEYLEAYLEGLRNYAQQKVDEQNKVAELPIIPDDSFVTDDENSFDVSTNKSDEAKGDVQTLIVSDESFVETEESCDVSQEGEDANSDQLEIAQACSETLVAENVEGSVRDDGDVPDPPGLKMPVTDAPEIKPKEKSQPLKKSSTSNHAFCDCKTPVCLLCESYSYTALSDLIIPKFCQLNVWQTTCNVLEMEKYDKYDTSFKLGKRRNKKLVEVNMSRLDKLTDQLVQKSTGCCHGGRNGEQADARNKRKSVMEVTFADLLDVNLTHNGASDNRYIRNQWLQQHLQKVGCLCELHDRKALRRSPVYQHDEEWESRFCKRIDHEMRRQKTGKKRKLVTLPSWLDSADYYRLSNQQF